MENNSDINFKNIINEIINQKYICSWFQCVNTKRN